MPSFFTERSLAEAALIMAITLGCMIGGGFVAFRIRPSRLLGIVMLAAVVQVWVPFTFISWALLLLLSLAPVAIVRSRRSDWSLWTYVVLGVGAAQGLSLLWSPTFGAVLQAGIATAALLVCYLLWRQALREGAESSTPLLIGAPAVVAQSALTILFRVNPGTEFAYLISPIARLFTEPGVELIAIGRYPNVLDPAKSGGLILNGNTAGLFLVLLCCLYAASAVRETRTGRRGVLWGVALISAIGAFATGSKSLLLLGLVLPGLAVILTAVVRRVRVGMVTLGAVVLAAVAGWIVLARSDAPLLGQIVTTFDMRTDYWSLAASAFPDHWLLGLGYGGWEPLLQAHWQEMYGNVVFQAYATHNFLVQAWVDAGVLHLLAVFVACGVPIWLAGRGIWAHRREPVKSAQVLYDAVLFVGVTWPVLHGLGDTTTFFGDNHTIVVYAALVAMVVEQGSRIAQRAEMSGSIAEEAVSG